MLSPALMLSPTDMYSPNGMHQAIASTPSVSAKRRAAAVVSFQSSMPAITWTVFAFDPRLAELFRQP